MKKKLTIVLLGAVVLLAGLGIATDAADRWRATIAFENSWENHWPLSRGKALPGRIRSLFGPFAPVRVAVEPGVTMMLDPDDLVSRAILGSGVWEVESWDAIEKLLSPQATFVDIGAHIGYYSLKAAKVVGPQGHVLSVEPNPETLEKLRRNVSLSSASVITIFPVACSDSEAVLELFAASSTNSGETSLARKNADHKGAGVKAYKVRARPLDDIILESGVARVDAIKIDVEGAELLVLKGAKQTLTRFRPVLNVEMIDTQLRAMGTSTDEVKQYLLSLGYRPRRSIGENIEFAKD